MKRPLPRLLLITEPVAPAERDALFLRIHAALQGGPCHLLVRTPGWCGRDFFALTAFLRTCVAPPGCLLVHDRVDIALATGADGVHLPASGLPTAVARRLLGDDLLVGRSCHDPDAATQALAEGADYVTLSPLFATPSHPDAVPLGTTRLADMVRSIPGPVIALGGIKPENAAAALTTGVAGLAVIRGILRAANPALATRSMLEVFPPHVDGNEKK
ncbi:MAG: thiamine phosphate synthase [Magnetococcales bacterium]|nr:thiamine phosphate synthase [Magnetococcales bacterium]